MLDDWIVLRYIMQLEALLKVPAFLMVKEVQCAKYDSFREHCVQFVYDMFCHLHFSVSCSQGLDKNIQRRFSIDSITEFAICKSSGEQGIGGGARALDNLNYASILPRIRPSTS